MGIIYYGLVVFWASIAQAMVSMIISLAIAFLLARSFYSLVPVLQRFWLVLVPFLCVISSKVLAIAINQTFALTGMCAILATHIFWNVPLAFYLFYTRYKKYDTQLFHAAADLGANDFQTVQLIELPFMAPLIMQTALIIFLLCFSSFSVPRLFATEWYHFTLTPLIAEAYRKADLPQLLFYFGLRLLLVVPLVSFKKHTFVSALITDRPVYSLKKKRNLFGNICAVFLMVFFCVPLGTIFFLAIESRNMLFWKFFFCGAYDQVIGCPLYQVMSNSLLYALCSSFLVVTAMFFVIFFMRNYSLVISIFLLVPVLLDGIGCGIFFKELLPHNVSAIILSHAFLNYPIAYMTIFAASAFYSEQLDLLAQNSGASLWQRMHIFALFMRTALVRTFFLTFSLSLSEVGAASLVVQEKGLTIPLAMRLYYKNGMVHEAVSLALLMLLLILFVAVITRRMLPHGEKKIIF